MKRVLLLLGLALLPVALAGTCAPAGASAAFGLLPGSDGFSMSAREEDGSVAHRAGSHPYRLTATVNLNLAGESPGEPGVLLGIDGGREHGSQGTGRNHRDR